MISDPKHVIYTNDGDLASHMLNNLIPFKTDSCIIAHYVNERYYDYNPYSGETSLRGQLCDKKDSTYFNNKCHRFYNVIATEIYTPGLYEVAEDIIMNATANNINAWCFGETTLKNIPETLPQFTWSFIYFIFKIRGSYLFHIRNYSNEIIRMQKLIFDNKMMFIWSIQNDIYPSTVIGIIYYMGMKFLAYIHLKELIEYQIDINELRQTTNDSVIREQLSTLIFNFTTLDLLLNSEEINAFELFVSKLVDNTSENLKYLERIFVKFKKLIERAE